jgi:hypothetical protein
LEVQVDAGVLIPLGVFAMLVAFSYIQVRAMVVDREARSREVLAAIEKGVPPPAPAEPLPAPPEAPGHPLKSTFAALTVGIALWIGLAPDNRVWGMVVTAFGVAGILHWAVVGRSHWRQQQAMYEEMHRAYVDYLRARAGSVPTGDAPQA